MNPSQDQQQTSAGPCSRLCRCGMPSRAGQRDCRACHAAYARKHRKRWHELSDVRRSKTLLSNRVRIALARGLLKKQPCCICGAGDVLAHHLDAERHPLIVAWLCRGCRADLNAGKIEKERLVITVPHYRQGYRRLLLEHAMRDFQI